MDIAWIAAGAALWALAAGMVVGLDRLAGPRPPAHAASMSASGARE
ncbi:MAG TPA: hypothetical protein VMR43_16395 [Variovorax sp.]|nr:hypothetical protein [Variovorax sp.]